MTNDAAVAWYYEFGDTGEAGPVTFGGDPGREAIEWAERYGHTLHYLVPATTVAELRARVEAAEQKLAEVVEAAIDFLEAADARDNEEVSTQYPDHEKRLRQYKAAREDLNAILPGPTP